VEKVGLLGMVNNQTAKIKLIDTSISKLREITNRGGTQLHHLWQIRLRGGMQVESNFDKYPAEETAMPKTKAGTASKLWSCCFPTTSNIVVGTHRKVHPIQSVVKIINEASGDLLSPSRLDAPLDIRYSRTCRSSLGIMSLRSRQSRKSNTSSVSQSVPDLAKAEWQDQRRSDDAPIYEKERDPIEEPSDTTLTMGTSITEEAWFNYPVFSTNQRECPTACALR
jgi:hypothetical protein